LVPALNAFAAQYPEIEIDVSFSDRVVNLVDEGFDMAVRVGRPGDSSLIIRRLCTVRIVVVGAPDYLETRGAPEEPSGLLQHACIIDTNFREPNRWPFRTREGVEATFPVGGRVRYSNADACVRAAAEGLGLTCVPAFVAGEALRSGKLVRLLSSFEPLPLDVSALYPHSRLLAAKVRLLVDFLTERFRGTPPWEQGWAEPLPDRK
jgi:DNA-binding transcriptional LysR family regulator